MLWDRAGKSGSTCIRSRGEQMSQMRAETKIGGWLCLFGLALLASAASAAAQAPAGVADYRLGAEDVIEVQVWGRADLSGSVTVNLDGMVQIPLVGSLPAAGRTPTELARDLTARYQLLEPSVSEVTVNVLQYKALSIIVLGEVRSAGPYGFRELPDLWGAILAAGGPTEKAELGGVQIVRAQPEPGEERVQTVDLSAGLEGTDPALLPALRAKDSIMVPSAEGAPSGGSNVHVLGAVNAPGPYRLSVARSVVEALSASGGPRADADLGSIYLTRVSTDGTRAYKLNIDNYLKKARPLDNFPLQAGDTITVPQRGSFWVSFTEGLNRLIPVLSLVVTYIAVTN